MSAGTYYYLTLLVENNGTSLLNQWYNGSVIANSVGAHFFYFIWRGGGKKFECLAGGIISRGNTSRLYMKCIIFWGWVGSITY